MHEIGRTVAGQVSVADLVPGFCCPAPCGSCGKRKALRRGRYARQDQLGFFIAQAGVLSVMKRTHTCDGITLLREREQESRQR